MRGRKSFRLGGKTPSVVASPADHEALCRVLSRANEAGLGRIPLGRRHGQRDGLCAGEVRRGSLSGAHVEGSGVFERRPHGGGGSGNERGEAQSIDGGRGPDKRVSIPRIREPPRWGEPSSRIVRGPCECAGARRRDRVMRMKVALADGATHTYGALVVKNVTGYDMNRLLSGSWGTLAVVTELAIRLYKAPERVGARAASFSIHRRSFQGGQGADGLTPHARLGGSAWDEARIAALAPEDGAALPGPVCLVASFGDFEEGLNDQLVRFEEILEEEGGDDILRLDDETNFAPGPRPGRSAGRGLLGLRRALFSGHRAGSISSPDSRRRRGAPPIRGNTAAPSPRTPEAACSGAGSRRSMKDPSPLEAWRVFSSLCREGRDERQARSVHLSPGFRTGLAQGTGIRVG